MTHKHNHAIVEQVPVDYYQKGISSNLLQRIWHLNKLKKVMNLFKKEPKTILDVGCASGWFISQISKKFPDSKCYGIDVYHKGIKHANKLYPGIQFRVADAHNLPFKGETFDLVICTEVLEHVDDPKTVLLEIKRVLRENGSAVIELDSGSMLFSISWYLWGKWRGKVWNDAHLHVFNVKKLEKLLRDCKFSILEKKQFNLGMAMVFLIKK